MLKHPKFVELPIPPHFEAQKVAEIWKVDYQQRAADAIHWRNVHQIMPSAQDTVKVMLVAIDVQNTFCIPGFELFVAGRSGTGAIDDNRRLCEFIYRNLHVITNITATLDTHTAMQIFHPIFLVNESGEHPAPHTTISYDDIREGSWKFNPEIAASLGIDPQYGQEHLLHYAYELRQRAKYDLTIWPYHVMLGSIGHALVPAVEEAFFFHTIARNSQINFEIKGDNPLTEHYSAIGPEVLDGPRSSHIAEKNQHFLQTLVENDVVVIAGQAKSHCVAWTINDLLEDILKYDKTLVDKVYLLEDCTSPVVIPGIVDFSEVADSAFHRFAQHGMHVVRSTDPIDRWLNSSSAIDV